MKEMKKINLAIVGATGLVGRKMLQLLEERNFPINELKLFASAKTAGTEINFKNKIHKVEELTENSFKNLDIALFSAGSFVSENFAPIAVKNNCIVIDNGSFWRMNEKVPLIVPEINFSNLLKHNGLIANPNCSTIQLVLALDAISKVAKLKRVVASTYQAISGAGQKGIDKFHYEMNEFLNENKAKIESNETKIFNNIMFHSPMNESGNTAEEAKMESETKKILNAKKLQISVNCVRIPVVNSHSIFANIEFENSFLMQELEESLQNSDGIIYVKNQNENYPTPLLANGKDEVFVGRLRRDKSVENAVNMWIVADNLRKGAATNAVQIAEFIAKNDLYNYQKVEFK
jgi:aspartate-semialdehyde dehydrogenase